MNLSFVDFFQFSALTRHDFFLFCHDPFSLLLLVRNGARGARARSRVSLGALTAYGQPLSVAHAAIASDFHQTLDIEADRAAQFAFHRIVVIDIFSELGNVVLVQILHPRIGINTRCREDLLRRRQTDSVYVPCS